MLKLLRLYMPYKKYLILAVVCNVFMSAFMVVTIPLLQPLLSVLFGKNSEKIGGIPKTGVTNFFEKTLNSWIETLVSTQGQMGAVAVVGGFMVLAFFGKNLFRYLAMYFIAPMRTLIVRDFRNKLQGKMLELPLSYYSESRKGDLLSRATADVTEIEWSIMGVLEAAVREPLIILSSLAFMLTISPSLTLYTFLLIFMVGAVIGVAGKNLRRQSNTAQNTLGYLVSLLDETLSGLRIIKGFNAQNYQKSRFQSTNDDYAKLMTKIYRRRDLASPLSEFLGICTVVFLLWVGAGKVFAGELSAETFITFLYAFYSVIEPAKAFSSAMFSIQKGKGALQRVESILEADNEIEEATQAIHISQVEQDIVFENVSFRYANSEAQALNTINLTIKKGQIVALVGASGAGKSTMADLLPRFFDPTEGKITIDGHDIRQLSLKSLRGLMAIVGQDPTLFNDSVRNNILFGMGNVSDNQLREAAKAAHALEFIEKMPEGMETSIGDRGMKLSGGQRQRLTIARALLRNAPLLILDEATSALDSESEKLVQKALENLMLHRTALVIAHRLSTIQHADLIVVMDAGKIVEQGTHTELMVLGKHYKKLVELQMLT